MWSRVVEIMLGCWLLVSPFVLRFPTDRPWWWITDLAAGSAVILCGLLSHARRTRYAYCLTLAVAVWLIASAYLQAFLVEPSMVPSPAQQNDVILGLLLLMFALVPNEASRPPESWTESLLRPMNRRPAGFDDE